MKEDDFNDFVPSILNPRVYKKDTGVISLTQNSITSRCSLSLRRNNGLKKLGPKINRTLPANKENLQNVHNVLSKESSNKVSKSGSIKNNDRIVDADTIGFSDIQDLSTVKINSNSSPLTFDELFLMPPITKGGNNTSLISVSSATELGDSVSDTKFDETVIYEESKPVVTVTFGVHDCKEVDVSTNNISIKRILISHKEKDINVECEVIENSELSTASDVDENMNEVLPSPPKKIAVAVNLDIKKKKLSNDTEENSKVLILNTDAIEKLSHVIVQPPNYKLVKRKLLEKGKFKSSNKKKTVFRSPRKNGKISLCSDNLKQKLIDGYLSKDPSLIKKKEGTLVSYSYEGDGVNLDRDDAQDMSKNLGVADAIKYDRYAKSVKSRKESDSPRSFKVLSTGKDGSSTKRQDVKTSSSDAPRGSSPKCRNESVSSHSPRKNVESLQFSLPSKSKTNKSSVVSRNIPHHKIVAGTHFAVDAFSYGEIPNVKHYFLTHFHSDHYSGLKKSFNKLLFCSKITANLCVSRLGVSPKCIHVINPDETIRVEGVEVTAIDANHCPGAIMLVFTLPNGKTLLHCGDFRACPAMESYPIFWNRDVHTVYLDTTYCNPRYDFPTQDQSLEMALYLLRQKKLNLEKAGKKFSSVLIVCGTYTIGKEKFFLGMAKRVGCSVWAFPEKDRVLQAVEGRSFSHAPPQSCQLHVLAMKDLTYEKLKSYLESLGGAFSEVVAFKPSGWENGKNSTIEKDVVTIHGIPYSEHSSFSEMIRFVKFLKPKQVVPTVDISGGIKAVQKYFPCPLIYKEDIQAQSKLTDFFSIQNRPQVTAVT